MAALRRTIAGLVNTAAAVVAVADHVEEEACASSSTMVLTKARRLDASWLHFAEEER